MKEEGFHYSLCKIKAKWRSLVKSHKIVIDNKKKTGNKRKTFQYLKELSDILKKRHDIDPPVVAGSGIAKVQEGEEQESTSDVERKKSNPASAKKRQLARGRTEGNETIFEFLKELENQHKKELELEERECRIEERVEWRDRLLDRLIEKM